MDEFAHYIAHRRLDPPMDIRLEFMIAQLTAVYVSSVKGKKGKPPKATDFMLSMMMEDTQPSGDITHKIKASFSLFPKKE